MEQFLFVMFFLDPSLGRRIKYVGPYFICSLFQAELITVK